ncbi:MAG: Flp pilus assembly complex ATPase component TadA [Bacilli bacterium]|nr:Flp pilus assembly complex ATPase component TadA [Bacilli bacterium]
MMVQFDVKRVQSGNESFMVSFDFNKTPVTQIADYIIIAASKHGASDIHFDPRDEGMMVRFRIDGDCQDYTFVPKAYEKNLTTRLKLLANMNITESRLPQDGAIKGDFGGQYLDMRVSALPLNTGEKIVIRILDYSRSLQGVDTLGFHPKNLEKIKRMMGLPNGIILTTGATGSGKSTTTYSILQGLNKPETNVITVEDPIEMNIEGINQVQVNADIGMTFAAALRSILRQDPNVILIGEIRDSETAQIAVRASITGHLVLSTIHTNNALATVERLLDMNVERYLLSTALSGIISQRLAKMLCPECRIRRATTKYEKKVFKKFMKMDVDEVWDANPKGCEDCRRGYHGRIAVHEVLELDDELRAALSNEKLEKEDLAKKVYSHGTITMLQDALIKCLEGKTSFEEVYRTIEIENEDDDNYEEEINSEIKEAITVTEEPKVSDDLLETVVQEGHSEVFVPAVITAAQFSDKNDAAPAEGEQASSDPNAQPAQQAPVATPVAQPAQAPAPVQTIMPSAPAPTTVEATPAPAAQEEAKVIVPPKLADAPITPKVIVPSAQVETPLVPTTTETPQKLADDSGTTVVTSNPMDIKTLPSVQTGAVSIVNNSSTSGLPMSAALGQINVPLVTSQQATTPAVPAVSTVPSVQNNSIAPVPPVSTLPGSNDTVLEAIPSTSVTTIAPKQNTYINPVPGGNNTLDNMPLFDTRNDAITLPTVLPDPITPGSSVEATDFLVQKPLMPNLPAKK